MQDDSSHDADGADELSAVLLIATNISAKLSWLGLDERVWCYWVLSITQVDANRYKQFLPQIL